MFPKEIEQMIQANMVGFNPKLASGLATHELKKSKSYIDEVVRALSVSFPWYVKYVGIRSLTPDEEFDILTRSRNQNHVVDIAENTFHMAELQFVYDDKKQRENLNRVTNLVYATGPGKIKISGSSFQVSPVLADPVFSIQIDHVFVRLLKAKITVNRAPHCWMCNGRQDATQVPYAKVYNAKEGVVKGTTVRAHTTLAHYLFTQFGVSGAFEKYAKIKIQVSDGEFNQTTHPKEEWYLCTSTQSKPRGVKIGYEPSKLQVAIRIEEMSAIAKSLLGGLFYMVDHFPDRIKAADIDDKDLIATMLGRLIWGDGHEGRILINIKNHFNSISAYIDEIILRKLGSARENIKDLYDLFAYVLTNVHSWLLMSAKRVNSMWDKELSVLQYVYSDLLQDLHLMSFKLNTMLDDDKPSLAAVQKALSEIKAGAIYGLNKKHGEISTETSPGDNPCIKLTSKLVPQSQSVMGQGRRDRVGISDPSRRFHPSTIEVGQYKALIKSNPTGDGRLNLHVQTDSENRVIRDPKYIKLFDELADFFQRQ